MRITRGRLRWFAVTGVIFTVVLVVTGYVQRSYGRKDAVAEENRKLLVAQERAGVGSEVVFADTAESVLASVAQVCDFIQRRSGLEIDQSTKDRLAGLEGSELAGEGQAIGVDDLTDILAQVVVDRIATLTKEELDHGIDEMRGFYAPDLPEPLLRGREGYIRLRATLTYQASADEVERAESLILDHSARDPLLAMVHSHLVVWTRARIAELQEALPGQFGGAGLTPLRAFMIAYSVIADDHLAFSNEQIQERMRAMQENISRMDGHYPSPDGCHAYGVNGYFYSRPIDLFIGRDRIGGLLNRLADAARLLDR